MKFPPFYAALLGTALLAAPAHLFAQTAAPATNSMGPRMTFDSKVYRFGKILAGEKVNHTFIVTNTGDKALDISKVSPGCHCTTAKDWTHHIEPGQTGQISIQFDSSSFRGNVTKNITVWSNDKLSPTQMISLEGTIWKQIDISPQWAYIRSMAGATNMTSTVKIMNQGDEPVTVSDPVSANRSFTAELKTLKPGKEFELIVTAVPPLPPGTTTGTITIKTSLTNMPMINITTIAQMEPAITVTPLQMVLPPRVERWTTNSITISDNETRALTLSNASFCCDKSVGVDIKTVATGRVYRVNLIFPPGYKSSSVQQPRLTIQTDNPRQPLITVLVNQIFSQMTTPAPRLKAMSQSPPASPVVGHP